MLRTPTGQTRLAAVIGSPVRHSLSPRIHNAAFAHLGLDWVYTAFDVAAKDGQKAVEAMRTLGIGGLSVTMPHKQVVAATVDRLTPAAEALQVSNCVFWDGESLVGDNTDGDGFVASLRFDVGVDLKDRTIAVIGTGGAARSIIEASGRSGAAKILVIGRSQENAESAAALASQATVVPPEAAADADVITNATPVGMNSGLNPQTIPLPADVINETHIVHDCVYDPRVTSLLAIAEQKGATAVGGTGMLVHQAAAAFTHWTGHPAPIDVMTNAVAIDVGQ